MSALYFERKNLNSSLKRKSSNNQSNSKYKHFIQHEIILENEKE